MPKKCSGLITIAYEAPDVLSCSISSDSLLVKLRYVSVVTYVLFPAHQSSFDVALFCLNRIYHSHIIVSDTPCKKLNLQTTQPEKLGYSYYNRIELYYRNGKTVFIT